MNSLCLLTNLSSSEWAAWVQAVGSIGAIAVAILVARQATRNSEELVRAQMAAQEKEWRLARRLRYSELLAPALAILNDTFWEISARKQAILKGFPPGEFALPSDFLSNAMKLTALAADLPVRDMPTPRAATALMEASRHATSAYATIVSMVHEVNLLQDPKKHMGALDDALTELYGSRSKIKAELELLLRATTDAEVAQITADFHD